MKTRIIDRSDKIILSSINKIKMRYYILILFASLFSCENNGSNKRGNLTDKEIALAAAEKKWNDVYGKLTIDRQKTIYNRKEK